MTDLAYYLSFVLNAFLAVVIFFAARAAVKTKRLSEDRAKLVYSMAVIVGGVWCGFVLFHVIVGLFRVLGFSASYGHGEVIVAAVVFNLLLSVVLLVAGRILLGWRPFQWQ